MSPKFQQSILLFASLGDQCTALERTLPKDEARRKITNLLIALSDSDFELISGVVELCETEPGRRLFEINTSGFRQQLLEVSVVRKRLQSANAGKPVAVTEPSGERQKQKTQGAA
jgi:hypothetical protein